MGEDVGGDAMKGLLIGLASVARAGKDTFAALLVEHLTALGQPVSTWAFADSLKRELEPVIRTKYGISVWTQDTKEKTLIRNELVALGRRRREESNGRHWIEQIDSSVRAGLDAGIHQVVKDVRYATHAADEAGWIHSLGGKVLYIERMVDGVPVPPANEEEEINDPKVRAAADLVVTMPTFGADYLDKMRPYVQSAWSQLNT